MFKSLRDALFPPAPEAVFVDPVLGTLTWDRMREVWWAEFGPAGDRHRFAFCRLKPSPVPPEPLLASAREMVARLDEVLRRARGLIADEAAKSKPERAAQISGLTVGTFHLQMDQGKVCGHLGLEGPSPGWQIVLSNGMPMWLEIASN